MMWPSSGTKTMIRNSSEFIKHPRLPDIYALLIIKRRFLTTLSAVGTNAIVFSSLLILRAGYVLCCKLVALLQAIYIASYQHLQLVVVSGYVFHFGYTICNRANIF